MNDESTASAYGALLPELRDKLRKDLAFQAFTSAFQTKLVKGEMARVVSTESLLASLGADVPSYKTMIKLWSANIHATPLSWHRMGEHSGSRGLANDRDRVYVAESLEYLVGFLNSAAKQMASLMPAIEAEHAARTQRQN